MNNDRYTRFLLTVIAFSLAAIAARGLLSIPEARAAIAEPMKCEIIGTVNVAGKIGVDTLNNPVTVRGTDDFQIRVRDTVPVKVERSETVPVKIERIDSTVQVHNN